MWSIIEGASHNLHDDFSEWPSVYSNLGLCVFHSCDKVFSFESHVCASLRTSTNLLISSDCTTSGMLHANFVLKSWQICFVAVMTSVLSFCWICSSFHMRYLIIMFRTKRNYWKCYFRDGPPDVKYLYLCTWISHLPYRTTHTWGEATTGKVGLMFAMLFNNLKSYFSSSTKGTWIELIHMDNY